MRPFPLVLSAPSGGGKTTIARKLLSRRGDEMGYSVSCTTRAPRAGEESGRDYWFLSTEEFQGRVAAGEFAEWAEVHGNLYGTLRSEIDRVLRGGRSVVMDIDVRGAAQFKAAFPDSVRVFLLPPSADVLLERLVDRGTEGRDAVVRRLQRAAEELRAAPSYDYVVVNDDLERTYNRVSAIVDAESARLPRVSNLDSQIASLVDGLNARLTQHQ